jgi:hypothetical protein
MGDPVLLVLFHLITRSAAAVGVWVAILCKVRVRVAAQAAVVVALMGTLAAPEPQDKDLPEVPQGLEVRVTLAAAVGVPVPLG